MANIPITNLPSATALTGSELVPIVQGGTTKKTTVSAFATAGITSIDAAIVFGDATLDAYAMTSDAFSPHTGVAYTIVPDDNGRIITYTSSIPATITVPAGLDPGFSCVVIQLGDGQVVLASGPGVTLDAYLGSMTLAGRYAAASLFSPTADTYVLAGNLA